MAWKATASPHPRKHRRRVSPDILGANRDDRPGRRASKRTLVVRRSGSTADCHRKPVSADAARGLLHGLRRIGVTTAWAASTLGAAVLFAANCAGLRNITLHWLQALNGAS
jgi:hypothetical protein